MDLVSPADTPTVHRIKDCVMSDTLGECESKRMTLHKELIYVSVLGWYFRNKKTYKKNKKQRQLKKALFQHHVHPSVCLWPCVNN